MPLLPAFAARDTGIVVDLHHLPSIASGNCLQLRVGARVRRLCCWPQQRVSLDQAAQELHEMVLFGGRRARVVQQRLTCARIADAKDTRSSGDLQEIVLSINLTPRKCLNYLTPANRR